MAHVVIAPALARWLPAAAPGEREIRLQLPGATVAEVLQALFAQHPQLRAYVLDERGAVRHHVVLFVDGVALKDKARQALALGADSELYLLQALSGG